MIKKAIKILAAAVVAIAAFAFAGTTEARAETLLSGNFSSIGKLDAQFDGYACRGRFAGIAPGRRNAGIEQARRL